MESIIQYFENIAKILSAHIQNCRRSDCIYIILLLIFLMELIYTTAIWISHTRKNHSKNCSYMGEGVSGHTRQHVSMTTENDNHFGSDSERTHLDLPKTKKNTYEHVGNLSRYTRSGNRYGRYHIYKSPKTSHAKQ